MSIERTGLNSDIATVLFHETTILSRLDTLAQEIATDYAGKSLTVVAILHGGLIFAADLLRRIDLPLKVATLNVSSYHGGMESSGTVTFDDATLPDLAGEHVLLLDDILDTGRTVAAICQRLTHACGVCDVRVCVLLDKKEARIEKVDAEYVGFEIGDDFVVGYGLDYCGHYRNLPFVGTLKPEVIEAGGMR